MWDETKQRRFDELRRDDAAPLTPVERRELDALIDELDREEREQLGPALAASADREAEYRAELARMQAEKATLVELTERYTAWLLRARRQIGEVLDEREELRAEYGRVTH